MRDVLADLWDFFIGVMLPLLVFMAIALSVICGTVAMFAHFSPEVVSPDAALHGPYGSPEANELHAIRVILERAYPAQAETLK